MTCAILCDLVRDFAIRSSWPVGYSSEVYLSAETFDPFARIGRPALRPLLSTKIKVAHAQSQADLRKQCAPTIGVPSHDSDKIRLSYEKSLGSKTACAEVTKLSHPSPTGFRPPAHPGQSANLSRSTHVIQPVTHPSNTTIMARRMSTAQWLAQDRGDQKKRDTLYHDRQPQPVR
jgi:hypothetical protein